MRRQSMVRWADGRYAVCVEPGEQGRVADLHYEVFEAPLERLTHIIESISGVSWEPICQNLQIVTAMRSPLAGRVRSLEQTQELWAKLLVPRSCR